MRTGPSVVVGVDGSASSEAACVVACAEAASRRLPLTLLTACEPHAPTPGAFWGVQPGVPDPAEQEACARQALVRTAETVARAAPELALDLRLVRAAPVDALLAAAHDAAMLVVGGVDRGRHEVGWLGPVPLHVAGRTACPVIVVPTGPVPAGPVVVGIDDSGLSAAAVAFAFAQAARWDLDLVAVHAIGSDRAAFVRNPMLLAGLQERARVELSEALVGWSDKHPDVRVTGLVTAEHPVRALRCAASDASMLVLGSLGRGAAARDALGSISATLLRISPCSVAVVTPQDR